MRLAPAWQLFHLVHLLAIVLAYSEFSGTRNARRHGAQEVSSNGCAAAYDVERQNDLTVRVVHKGGPGLMLPPPQMRDWARSLLEHEGAHDVAPHQSESIAIVYEKLRQGLCPVVGSDGFQMMATRALMLANSAGPEFGKAKIAADGDLYGLVSCDLLTDPEAQRDAEGAVMFIAHLFGLFLNLLGSITTQRLVHNVFPALEMSADAESDVVFENVMYEATQLRSTGLRLKSLAEEHPEIRTGLDGLSDHIRDMALILDIFGTIKRRAGQVQNDKPDLQKTRYLM